MVEVFLCLNMEEALVAVSLTASSLPLQLACCTSVLMSRTYKVSDASETRAPPRLLHRLLSTGPEALLGLPKTGPLQRFALGVPQKKPRPAYSEVISLMPFFSLL